MSVPETWRVGAIPSASVNFRFAPSPRLWSGNSRQMPEASRSPLPLLQLRPAFVEAINRGLGVLEGGPPLT